MTGFSFQAATPTDLGLPLQRVFAEARETGSEFTLMLAPGTYSGLALILDASRQPGFTLHIVGNGAEPAILRDGSLQASASTVILENLIIADRAVGPPVLQLAASRLRAEQMVIAQNHCGERTTPPERPFSALGDRAHARPVVELRSAKQDIAADMAFEACWFIGNLTWDGGALVEATLNSASDCGIGQLRFAHCLFAGNAVGCDVEGHFARDIRFESCLIHESRVYAPWLRLFPRECDVTLRGGLLALEAKPRFLQSETTQRGFVLENVATFFGHSREDVAALPLPQLPETLLELARQAHRPPVGALIAALLA